MKSLNYVADYTAYKLVDQVASSSNNYWSLHKAVYDHGDDHDNVLIKIFNINHKDDMYPLDPLIKEISVAKKCCEHVNMVQSVHCDFKVRNHLCVVMPNPKKPLPSISVFKHGLPEEIVAFVIMQILQALHCMHESGERVHGNLRCTNVFLDEEANVKIEFPTWLTNPEMDVYPSTYRKCKKSDFNMVGTLAYDLFKGEETKAGCFTGPVKKKLPELMEDFVKFCASSRDQDTVQDLMSHKFLEKFCDHFDQYREDLKKLLTKKLRRRISSLFLM